MRKSICLVVGAIFTILLCMSTLTSCVSTLTAQNNAEMINRISLTDVNSVFLETLGEILPNLYVTVTSQEWKSMNGLEQLHTITKPTLSALGIKLEGIEKILLYLDVYDSKVPLESKTEVRQTFGLVGKTFLIHFIELEILRQGNDLVYEDYALRYSESHPEALVDFRDCLDRANERLRTRTRLIFDDWVSAIDVGWEVSDIQNWHKSAYRTFSRELANIVQLSNPDAARVCYAQHLESANEDRFELAHQTLTAIESETL